MSNRSVMALDNGSLHVSNGDRQLQVGILGATGTVGQRFIVLLARHPCFRVVALGASERSAKKTYRDATRWKQPTSMPAEVSDMRVSACTPEAFTMCDVVFSGLDSDVAGEVEAAFRDAELVVFSNSKNYRRADLVPLVVPLVNLDHLAVVSQQKKVLSKKKGYIVTNANCSTTGLVIPLYALEQAFGPIDAVHVVTLQAISGAGYPGVASLDILDNVVPYIGGGEEEKLEWETGKILGGIDAQHESGFRHRGKGMLVSAAVTRVPVIDGHSECVSVRFAKRPPPSPEQAAEALRQFVSEAQKLRCHSAPKQAITVHTAVDRPQPRLDRYDQDGAGVHVGRIRLDGGLFDLKFVLLANNVSIGAATSSIINAEAAVKLGYL